MAFTADTLAQELDDEGLTTYNPTSGGGSCFANMLPSKPDAVLVVSDLGGEPVYTSDGAHEGALGFQLRYRGEPEAPQAAFDALSAMVTHLVTVGHHSGSLAVGSAYEARYRWLTATPPASMGVDEHQRPEFVSRVTVYAPL